MRTHRTDPQTSRKSQRPAASKPPVVAASSKSKLVHVLTRFALSSFVQPPNAWLNRGCFRTVLDRLGNFWHGGLLRERVRESWRQWRGSGTSS